MKEHVKPVVDLVVVNGDYNHDQIESATGAAIIGVVTSGRDTVGSVYLCRSQSVQFCPNCTLNNLEKGRCIKTMANQDATST